MKAVRITLLASLIGTSIMLTGCGGGGPSVEDVSAAMKQALRDQFSAALSMGLKMDVDKMVTVKEVKDCSESSDDIYQCTVEATMDNPLLGKKTTISKMSFTKNSEGQWRVVE